MKDLLKKKCIPCEGLGMKPFLPEEAEKYLPDVPGWALSERQENFERIQIQRFYRGC